MFFCEN